MIKRVFVLVVVVMSVIFAASSAYAEEPPPDEPSQIDQSWDRLGVDEASGLARTELALWQFTHGLFLGLQSCAIVDCDDPRVLNSMPTLGSALGLGGSLWLTRDGITSGQARAINSGSLWGAWYGFAAGTIGGHSGSTVLRTMMATQLIGTGVGFLLSEQLRPTGGDVRLVNHTAAWTTAYYLLISQGLLGLDQSNQVLGVGLIASATLGGFLGSQIALEAPMSASRVAVISASGLLGGVAGSSAPVMIYGEQLDAMDNRIGMATVFAGSAIGLGVGTYLTRDWDRDVEAYQRADLSLSVLPTPEADGVQAALHGQF